MSDNRYLRNKVDGTIYHWNPILAVHPKCEEVTEQQAFPERFKPARASRKSALDLSTKEEDIPKDPPFSIQGLAEEAGKNWP